MTTSILFPQALQSLVALLASERAATFVFDFAFPDMVTTSFHLSVLKRVYPAGNLLFGISGAFLYARNPLFLSRGKPYGFLAGETQSYPFTLGYAILSLGVTSS